MITTKKQISETINAQGVLPLMSHPDTETCLKLLRSSYRAGIRAFEFACRYPNAPDVFRALRKYSDEELPGMILGVGTILTKADAKKYVKMGASFIVAPILDEETGDFCVEKKIFWCPGAGTLTEIIQAYNMGADLVKIFPAETVGGPAFVRAIKAPCPWVPVMPTGGVTIEETNLRAWFESGVECVGIGSALYRKDLVENAGEEELTNRVKDLLNLISKIRLPARSE